MTVDVSTVHKVSCEPSPIRGQQCEKCFTKIKLKMDPIRNCRDAAWDAIQTEAQRLRPAYEAEVHRNNAIIEGGGIRIVKDLSPGDEILLSTDQEGFMIIIHNGNICSAEVHFSY